MKYDIVTRTILGYTAETLMVNPDEIISACRNRELVLARSIFADIAYYKYRYTFQAIGKILNRHHATIMHNVYTFHNDVEQRPELSYLRQDVLRKVNGFLQLCE
jgi:chromosomal replication initiation ATPase DnaA